MGMSSPGPRQNCEFAVETFPYGHEMVQRGALQDFWWRSLRNPAGWVYLAALASARPQDNDLGHLVVERCSLKLSSEGRVEMRVVQVRCTL
jgi:hypothetical protein